MELNKLHIKLIQDQLNKLGYQAGIVDGIVGNKTKAALSNIVEIHHFDTFKRRAIAFIQLLCEQNNIDAGIIDGYWGPQTDFAFGILNEFLKIGIMPEPWRDEPLISYNPNNWPREETALLEAYYGEVGKHQKRLHLPYSHKLSWDKRHIINSFFCHEKVHESLDKVLTAVLNHYGIVEIKKLGLDIWGGCLNVRKKRGGTNWSTHSWGIALDYNPEQNALRWGRDKALFAQSEYNIWWEIWEKEGWVSLGREKNYDWMHVQAAKI